MFQGMDYIYEVYKEMSFSKAAKNLFISQPSLSAAVKKAEARIGFPVFDRSSNPIRLTEPGEEYIRSIERIMEVERSFENYVRDMQELKSGKIAIGATNLFASYVLPPLLSRFTESFPMVHVDIVEASTAELGDRLFSGALDLMIDNQVMDDSIYEKTFFCQEHLLLVVPKHFISNEKVEGYALTISDVKAGRHLDEAVPPVPLEAFRGDPFLLLKEGNDTRSRAEKLCRDSGGFFPKVRLELAQQITAYHLSRYGMGISFNGDVLVRHMPDDGSLAFYKLGYPDAVRNVYFFYKRNRYMSRVAAEFLKLIG
ncbi:MAG TPA: LysR family transcriptional regulator [Lachnospiraceae bacterium]|nr:LysR family transcriptional regulator [Lachnospiraceae bacterium]